MKNILIKIEYKGTRYSGWQIQPNSLTVQQVIQDVFRQIGQCKLVVKACSRTDAGVHARDQIATVLVPDKLDLYRLFGSVNSMLPNDIAVTDMVQVPLGFSARQAAKKKRYIYQIYNSQIKNVFDNDTHTFIKTKLNINRALDAIGCYLGTHDFSAFRGKGCQQPNPVKSITHTDVVVQSSVACQKIYLIFEGSGFLKNMVRIMSGTVMDIARGKLNISAISKALDSGNRDDAGVTAPAKGLVLDRVYLEPDPFMNKEPDFSWIK